MSTTPHNMRGTGPTPLPPEGLAALSRQVVSHRSDAFRQLLMRVIEHLKPVFGSSAAPLPFTASGTGGMEAAIVNVLEPGQRALAVNAGMFGERFASIARAFGVEVIEHVVPRGCAPDPDDLARALRAAGAVDAVLLTHNETSTGVLAPLAALAERVRGASDALLLVDAISSAGATPIQADAWGLDVVVTASQKALMAPPGLALISVSERSFERARRSRMPRYYFDFLRMRDAVVEGSTTYTPAVSAIYGLEAALDRIHAEGLTEVFARHSALSRACREGAEALGLTCLSDPACASPTVTTVLLPEGTSAKRVRLRLEEEHGVVVSQGRGPLKERMIRIGHMGHVTASDVEGCLQALRGVMGA